MSVRDEIDEIESSLKRQRYPEELKETAREVEEFFPDMDDALEYVNTYREAYSGEKVDDPVGFAKNWHDTFGDMSGIIEELGYQD